MRNKNNHRKAGKGLTLVELIVGIALLIFILASALIIQRSFSTGALRIDNNSRVSSKLRSVAERIRYEASYRWPSMSETGVPRPVPDLYDRNIHIISRIDDIDNVT